MSLARTIHFPFLAEPGIVSIWRLALRRWSERRAERRRLRQARHELAQLDDHLLRDTAHAAAARAPARTVPRDVLTATPEETRRGLLAHWML